MRIEVRSNKYLSVGGFEVRSYKYLSVGSCILRDEVLVKRHFI